MGTRIRSQRSSSSELLITMLLPLLLLCSLSFTALVAADGPDGYISPWSRGGNMTTVPLDPQNNRTRGMPLNLIISNKSDIHSYSNPYDSPPQWYHDYFTSLGYGRVNYQDRSHFNVLPLNDTVMLMGRAGPSFIIADFFSPDCKDSNNPCLQFLYGTESTSTADKNYENSAAFVSSALVHSTNDSVEITDNGYDLARDQLVARATSSYSGEPVLHYSNKSIAYKTTVVYNDTELLSNVLSNELRDNVGTDAHVPVLLVKILYAPFNESTKSYPEFKSGAAVWASLPTVSAVLFASMIALLPMVL